MMVITGLSLVSTVLVIRIHHRPEQKPMPTWFRSLVFVYLARLVCKQTQKNATVDIKQSDNLTSSTRKLACNDGNSKQKGHSDDNNGKDEAKSAWADNQDDRANEKTMGRNIWQRSADILDKFFMCFYLLIDSLIVLVIFGLLFAGDKYSRLNLESFKSES